MYQVLAIISIIACVLLGLIILIQNPKGGGLSSGFAGSNNIMGVQRTGDFLEKGTWGLIVLIMVLSLLVNVTIDRGSANSENDLIQQQIDKPAQRPVAPLPLPGLRDTTK
jgi:preprotein translocase subunit SecG